MSNDPVGQLRYVGFAEAVSYLLLLGVAMPLKYAAGLPGTVRVVGMLHGILFMLYVAAALRAAWRKHFSIGLTLLVLAASLVPFGPFLIDRRLKREAD